ncbi:MAG: 6-carboxytetrahydropterin synthase, partial [Erysipelotrichaceae bacterium]|nr:6-carboxytetrahydropterin synthase [Erysipelotrichaceae bacterium]
FDHENLNNFFYDINPTAEHMAEYLVAKINKRIYEESTDEVTACCYRVDVQETEGNIASYDIGENKVKELLNV